MADDQPDRLIETLSSCPRALQELSKALMPTLMKNLTTLTEETRTHEVPTEPSTGRNSVATHGSDEEDDVNRTQRDEPRVHSREGNEAIRNHGNEANYGYGDEAGYNYYYGGNHYGDGANYYGGSHGCYGNELYPTPYTPASGNWMPQMPRIPPSSMLYPWCWPGPPPPPPPPGWLPNPIQGQPGPQPQSTAQVGQPSRKRPRETARETNNNSTEDEVDPFVPSQERRELLGDSTDESISEGEEPPAKKKFVPNEELLGLLNTCTLRPMKNENRRKVIDQLPTLSCDAAHPPKLNDALAHLLPKQAKTHDSYLSKLQRFTMDAIAPITWLLEQMEQGPIEEETCKKAVRSSLQLLGNATAHFNVERRKEIMKHLNTDIKFLAETEFPQSGPYLFGEDFGSKAKTAADNIRALKGVQSSKNRFFGAGGPNKKAKSTPQGRRQDWGVSPQPHKSVFNRLGKSQPYRNPQHKFNKPANKVSK